MQIYALWLQGMTDKAYLAGKPLVLQGLMQGE